MTLQPSFLDKVRSIQLYTEPQVPFILHCAATFYTALVLRAISEEQCMKNRKCRSYARGDSVWLTKSHIDKIARLMNNISRSPQSYSFYEI